LRVIQFNFTLHPGTDFESMGQQWSDPFSFCLIEDQELNGSFELRA